MVVAQSIVCSHCGGPIDFEPGELYATCKYCGYTTVIETGEPFSFDHSLLLNKYDQVAISTVTKSWMTSGFLKPGDLTRKSKVLEQNLLYLPFWVISAKAKSSYKGIFERISPPIIKEGTLEKEYNWLVLAREASGFPSREFDVPLEGKIPFDFRRIEKFAKILNSEIGKDEALELARQQIDAHHRFLLQKDMDRIIEMVLELDVKQMVYLHAPIWFIKYEYKGGSYQIIIDGSEGTVLKGDIPNSKFGIL
jgi:hypothetical protein